MKDKTKVLIAAFAAFLVLPGAASAQDAQGYAYAYIRYLDGSVELQRATEAEPTDAGINLPIQSGDRAWTHPHARAELEYGDGSLLRMDGQTRVDFVDFGERGGETFVRLWSGSIILHLNEEKAKSFRLDTPAGTIYPASAGTFRIDVHDGGETTVLSVYEGVAELASEGGSTLVRSGQRSIVEPGRRPEPSFSFNTARLDEFLAWSEERDRQYAVTENIEGVPPEVGGHAGALSHHGTWRVDVSLGPVWYPSVSVGWYPYSYGRWVYSAYGWTWVSYEPWGWAPYHYGRWGYNHFGWYWIPGAHWGPAWVSWAIGPSWIGWCPLGYYDRPVHHYNRIWYRGGKAVPRGGAAGTRGHGWNFTRTADFGRGSASRARLRTADIQGTSRQARLLESGAVLDRNFKPRAAGAAAMTRLPKGGIASIARSEERRGRAETGGALQTGRARSRTAPGPTRSSGGTPPLDRSSELRQGDSRIFRDSSRGSAQPSPGTPERSRVSPRSQTSRSQTSRPLDDSRIRSTVRGMFRDSQARESAPPSSRPPSSVRQRTEPRREQPSRTERSAGAQQSRRDPAASRPSSRDRSSVERRFQPPPSPDSDRSIESSQPSRGRTRTIRPSPSRSQSEARPSRPSGSERGRSFFSNIIKSRPPSAPSRTSPRSRPSVERSRPSGQSRPPKVSQPSRSSGSKSSGQSGSAKSSRGRAKPRKKKN